MSLDIYLTTPPFDTGAEYPYRGEIHWQNITHNVAPMWCLAGCYHELYGRDADGNDVPDRTAGEILPALTDALAKMESEPAAFGALNPENGWGDYRGAVRWLREFIAACREHPKALVRVSA